MKTDLQKVVEWRQADSDRAHEDALRYEGRHPDQIAEREARARDDAERARKELRAAALAEAEKRGLSFAVPTLPSEGWASSQVNLHLARIFGYARDVFVELFEAEQRTRAAKRALGGDDRVALVNDRAGIADFETERHRLNTLEARFEIALEQLTAWRARVASPAYVAELERVNAIEGAFDGYIGEGMPEEQAIATAITAFVEAVASVRARHEAALAKNSDAVRGAMWLGVPMSELPDTMRLLNALAGISFVQRVAARAALEARQRLGIEGWTLNGYRPDFADPYLT